MTTREKDEQRKKQTPIIDGDARPDTPQHDELREKQITSIKDDKKTTKNRVDTNSLEDFRDAKQE
jgi:hypothetical protein